MGKVGGREGGREGEGEGGRKEKGEEHIDLSIEPTSHLALPVSN